MSKEDKINDVMIGGNHLAIVLLGTTDPSVYRNAEYGAVLEAEGQPYADIWAAWKAIMDLRDSLPCFTRVEDHKNPPRKVRLNSAYFEIAQ